jgi:tRNA1(Val) A37 N6-methylase TrmN6
MRPSGWAAVAERLPYSKGRVALLVRELLLAEILETEVNYKFGGDEAREL